MKMRTSFLDWGMPVIACLARYSYLIAACLALSSLCHAHSWQRLQPGIEYVDMQPVKLNLWGYLHAFRIDMNRYRLQLAFAQEHQGKTTSVKQLVESHNALLGINGGFFDTDHSPLGLRVRAGKVHHAMKKTPWWGVFYTIGKHAYVSSQQQFRHRRNLDFAVQGGPRLVVDRKIPRLKPGLAERTALCITNPATVILIVTQRLPMTTTELAKLLRDKESEGGFDCRDAINLDGGRSTQLYAEIGKFQLAIPGMSQITDAVLVTLRK